MVVVFHGRCGSPPDVKAVRCLTIQGVMQDFGFGVLTRNMGVVYKYFIPFVAMVTGREALLQGVGGR